MPCNSINDLFGAVVGNIPELPVAPSSSRPCESVSRMRFSANRLAGSEAREFVRSVLAERTVPKVPPHEAVTDRLVDDALLLVNELVVNAVMHAGTDIEVVCRVGAASRGSEAPDTWDGREGSGRDEEERQEDDEALLAVVVEVLDHHPSSAVPGGPGRARQGRKGHGLQLVSARAESWGVTYRRTRKAVWFRLCTTRDEIAGRTGAGTPGEAPGRVPVPSSAGQAGHGAEWAAGGGSTFLAEASELLAGQLDADMVAALAGQLLVPRLADWCGVWLTTEDGGMRLSRVWHSDERRIDALRSALSTDPPAAVPGTGTPWPWPEGADVPGEDGGSALAFPLHAGATCQGLLIIGRTGQLRMTDAVARTVEDLARLVAQALATAHQYTLQTTISRALQRRQLPASLATIPGVETAIVYEPYNEGQTVGGDFYDLFPAGDGRWCFLLGDVQGKDPEAMSVTGLARRLVRVLAREGHGVESVLDKVNVAMVEEGAETVELGGENAQGRLLSMLYGELEPTPLTGGARCTVASAGHPLPLRVRPDGTVSPTAEPQLLLGVDENTRFKADGFELAPGETLLCVTDGVTERRSGRRQLDDDDGLSRILADCAGMGAMAVAERVRQIVHDFDSRPPADDLAILVLHAVPLHAARGANAP
jgi:serine phosphatase RsbU (regulator of sigma subunit)